MSRQGRGAAASGERRRLGALGGALKVDPRTVQQEIVEKLREAILSGLFQPGDRLVEADLCASLGVSRPSLREALRSLHAERLVELVPNRGPQIPVLSWEDAQQIYSVRAMLEGEAAALCARYADAGCLEAMAAALDDFRAAVIAENPRARVEATSRFYTLLLRQAGNKVIEEIISGLLARINVLRARSMSRQGRARQSLVEMSAIMDAVRAGDPEAARRAAQHHVEEARAAASEAFAQSR